MFKALKVAFIVSVILGSVVAEYGFLVELADPDGMTLIQTFSIWTVASVIIFTFYVAGLLFLLISELIIGTLRCLCECNSET